MSEKVYLSDEGVKKLQNELHILKYETRPEISKKVNEAREQGDLKENAEYHAAREQLSLCESKIQQIQDKLSRAEIVKKGEVTDTVQMFSVVHLKNKKLNKKITYNLVSQEEADFSAGKISIISPVGKGLIGKKIGEIVTIKVPAGDLVFEILSIE